MSYGLRVWDSFGNLTVDVSDRLNRYVGTYSANVPGNSTVFVPVPGVSLDGTWEVAHANSDNSSAFPRQTYSRLAVGGIRISNWGNNSRVGVALVFRS